eukprot:scaffold267280_cov30-Tisochrysis_lutea.AAC.12
MEQMVSPTHASCVCVSGAAHLTLSFGATTGIADVKKERVPEPAECSSSREIEQAAEPSTGQSSPDTRASTIVDRSGL